MFPVLPGFSIMDADTPNRKGIPLVQVFQTLEMPLCPLTGRTQSFKGVLCSRVGAGTPISSPLPQPFSLPGSSSPPPLPVSPKCPLTWRPYL